MRKYLVAFIALALVVKTGSVWAAANSNTPSNGVRMNETGSSGVCVAVTTGAAVTVAHGDPYATGLSFYADQAMNCSWGDPADTAPTVTPTTGAVGTGAGFPIPATTIVNLGSGRALQYGSGSTLNLPPGDRVDCIAQATNGHVCTFRTY